MMLTTESKAFPISFKETLLD